MDLKSLIEELVEVPQLAWDPGRRRWRPLGRAVRAAVDGRLIVIDDVELDPEELGQMLAAHGAGLCILFLDD
jgi:hypothetical protein